MSEGTPSKASRRGKWNRAPNGGKLKNLPRAERERPRSRQGSHQRDPGDDYTPAEVEFMMAMDRYKRDHNRPYPDCSDILAVAKALGYRKPEEAIHDASEPDPEAATASS